MRIVCKLFLYLHEHRAGNIDGKETGMKYQAHTLHSKIYGFNSYIYYRFYSHIYITDVANKVWFHFQSSNIYLCIHFKLWTNLCTFTYFGSYACCIKADLRKVNEKFNGKWPWQLKFQYRSGINVLVLWSIRAILVNQITNFSQCNAKNFN